MPLPPFEKPPVNPAKILGSGLLVSDAGALDAQVGAVTGTLPDGTEYRQILKSPAPAAGTVYVTPDGRSWTAVPEQVSGGKVVATPTALQWKYLPETFSALALRLIGLLHGVLPGVFTTQPLPQGKVGPAFTIDPPSFQRLFVSAATQGGAGSVIWTQGSSELLVSTGQVKVQFDDGLIAVSIPVSCDQAASAVVQVPFAVGGKTSPAGMIAATEEKPRGPDTIVRIWGEALIAFAWQTLLTVITKVAAQSGTDVSGAALIPAAITAGTDGLHVLTQARQSFDVMLR